MAFRSGGRGAGELALAPLVGLGELVGLGGGNPAGGRSLPGPGRPSYGVGVVVGQEQPFFWLPPGLQSSDTGV